MSAHDTIGKVSTFRRLKCLHIIHLDLKCMSYDFKKKVKSNWKFDSRPQIPLEQGSNDIWLECAIHNWKDHFSLACSQKHWFEENMNVKNFETIKVSILGLPLVNPWKKCHLDVTPIENHRVYYMKGVVPPPKGCRSFKACAWGCPY